MNTEMTDEQPTTEQPTTAAAHQPGTHTPPPPPGWRRVPISRVPRGETDGGKVAGVVAGVSRAYGFDLRTTRIATVVSMLVLPVLWLVYAAAWILLPASPEQAVPIDAIVRDRRRLPLLVALALVLVVGGIGSLGSWFLFRGAPWGLVLIGIGVLLWVLSDRRRDVPPAASFPPPTAGVSFDAPPASSPSTTSVPVGPAAVTKERRPRRPIGSIGLGVAALWFGVAAALSGLGWWHAPSLWVLVSGLAIVMAALLASTIVNRSWVLPVPFALLAIVLISLCVAQPRLEGGSGDRSVHPTTIAAAEVAQHLAAGRLTLDLRDVPVGVRDVVVHAEVGFGNLEIDVPKDATLRLSTDAGIGGVLVNGRQIMAGVHQRDDRVVAPLATSVGTLILDLRVGMGRIDVVQVP